jgi:hypothetical protein
MPVPVTPSPSPVQVAFLEFNFALFEARGFGRGLISTLGVGVLKGMYSGPRWMGDYLAFTDGGLGS